MVSYSTLAGVAVLLIGAIEIGLFIYFFQYVKNITIKSYLWFIGGTVIWVVANGIAQIKGGDITFIENFAFLGGTILTTSFLVFAHSFPHPRSQNVFRLAWLSAAASTLFGYWIFATDTFLHSITLNGFVATTNGPKIGLVVWSIFLIAIWALSFVELVRRYRVNDGLEKKRLKYLIIGVLISGLVGIVSDVIIPLFGYGIIALGSSSTIVWLWFTVKGVRV